MLLLRRDGEARRGKILEELRKQEWRRMKEKGGKLDEEKETKDRKD